MSIKEIYKQMKELLTHIVTDLEKSENGNKAASQRVRTGTVKLEKVGKVFRKESIAFEKKNKGVKKSTKAAPAPKKAAAKAVESKGKSAAPASKAKPAPAKGKSKTSHGRG